MKFHISNISPRVSEEEFVEALQRYGQVISLTWSEQPGPTGRSVITAVAEMHLQEGLEAYRALNGKPFHHRRLYIVPLNSGKHLSNRG